MFCQKCGKEIPDDAAICPYCGAPTQESPADNKKKSPDKKKKKKVGRLCGAIIIVTVIVIIAVIIANSSKSDNSGTTTTSSPASQSEEQTEAAKVIYEDQYIKASYIKVYDDKTIDSSAMGVSYLQLHVENKSDKVITVSLSNAAINGMSTTFGSGVPMTIQPGNSSEQPFIMSIKNTSVKSADDINKLQFSFYLFDSNTHKIEETKVITVKVK